MAKAQQLITQDEINAGGVEQLWLDGVCKTFGRPECLPAEVKVERTDRDTNITTVWSRGRAVAIAIRQRDEFNFTVLTLVEFDGIEQLDQPRDKEA